MLCFSNDSLDHGIAKRASKLLTKQAASICHEVELLLVFVYEVGQRRSLFLHACRRTRHELRKSTVKANRLLTRRSQLERTCMLLMREDVSFLVL